MDSPFKKCDTPSMVHWLSHPALFHLRSDSRPVKTALILKQIGKDLYGIYEPIILYQLLDKHVEYVLFYYSIEVIMTSFLFYWGGRIMNKIGLRGNLIGGTAALTFALTVFAVITNLSLNWQDDRILIMLLLGCYSLGYLFYKILYWPAYHTDISLYTAKKHDGRSLGWLNLFTTIVGIACPFIGGLVYVTWGKTVLLVASLTTVAASIVPLLFMTNLKTTMTFSFKGFLNEFLNTKKIRTYISFAGEALPLYIGTYWGLYVFLNIKKIVNFGLLMSGVLLVSALLGLVMGYKIDKKERITKPLLMVGVIISSVGWLLKGLFSGGLLLFTTDNIQRFGYYVLDLPYRTRLYHRFQDRPNMADEYVIIRESLLSLFGGLALLIIGLAIACNPGWSYIAFILAALGTWGYLFI